MTEFVQGLPFLNENLSKMKAEFYRRAANDGLTDRAREVAVKLGHDLGRDNYVFTDPETDLRITYDEYKQLVIEVGDHHVLSSPGMFCVPNGWVERINQLYPGAKACMRAA